MPKTSQLKNKAMPKYPGLVERILEAMKDAYGSLNQTELAEKLGVKSATVTGWKNEGFISADSLLSISRLSNASISWLLTGEGAMRVCSHASETTKKYIELDPEIVELISTCTQRSRLSIDDKVKELLVSSLIGTLAQMGDEQSISKARRLTMELFEILSQRYKLIESHQIDKKP